MRLQNRLFFSYLVLILAQFLLFALIYYHVASKGIVDRAKEGLLDAADKGMELADAKMRGIEEKAQWVYGEEDVAMALEGIGQAEGSRLLDLDSKASAVLDKYFSGKDFVSVYIITPKYTLGNNMQVRVPPEQFYQSEIYRSLLEQEERGKWIPTYFAREEFRLDFVVEKETVFTYAYRMDGMGEVEGRRSVLLVNLNPDFFRGIFTASCMGREGFYCVSSQEGRIVAHTDPKKEGTGELLPWLADMENGGRGDGGAKERPGMELANGEAGGKRGSVEAEYQGREMVACYTVSESTGWAVSMAVPKAQLFQGMGETQYFLYGALGLLLALALLLAMLFAQGMLRPIERLAQAMEKVGEGDFSQRLPVEGNDEMQFLALRYNEMGCEIEKLIEENYKSQLRNRESEIMALNLQLNPHFLYNTLNVINLMALEEGELEISKMVISLSDMMQYTFRNKREMVRLEEELEWLRNYTYIMEQRFIGKFQVAYAVEGEALRYEVPKLLLEPLVENAIIHGFRHMDSGGRLEIGCSRQEGRLCLKVLDNGQGISEERLKEVMGGSGERIGLSNVKKRLELIYKGGAQMEIVTEEGAGCQVFLYLPLNIW